MILLNDRAAFHDMRVAHQFSDIEGTAAATPAFCSMVITSVLVKSFVQLPTSLFSSS